MRMKIERNGIKWQRMKRKKIYKKDRDIYSKIGKTS